MRCKSCGAQMDPGDHFCRECGMPVGGGRRADNKEEGYADNILSRTGKFDIAYFLPMAILVGILFIISGVLRMRYEEQNPEAIKETTAIETQTMQEDYWDANIYLIG